MAKKTDFFMMKDSAVAASTIDVDQLPIIPNGISVNLMTFGGTVPKPDAGSYVAIQWGSGAAWETIRAISGTFEFTIEKEFVGNGVKRFRVVRENKEVSAHRMFAWAEGFLYDA